MVIRRDGSVCIENAENPLPICRRTCCLLGGSSRLLMGVCEPGEGQEITLRERRSRLCMSCVVSPGMFPASNFFQLREPPEPSPPRTCLVSLEPTRALCIHCPPERSLQICCPYGIILFAFSLAPAGFICLWFPDTAGA